MARRVFLHVGLPKTGTTYLQTLMWDNHEELRRQGVLLPGESSRQHLWASGVVCEDPNLDRRGPEAPYAWGRLVEEINAWDGTAVVSHEFFASASAEQAARAVAALHGAEVHVVVTARETLSLVTARWQEFVKNGSTVAIDDYPLDDGGVHSDWGWATLDLADVLRRWGAQLPREHVHVLTLPKPHEPRDTLWVRFATVLGLDPSRVDSTRATQNESLGVVEVELLRRINADLEDFDAATDRGNWIRGYLAQGKLVPRGGERFWPSQWRVAELCERGRRIAADVEAAGYDVIGDIADLCPPDDVPPRRHPDSVTDDELVAAGTGVIAAMMTDVRRLTRQKRALTAAASAPAPPPPPPSGWRDRLRRRAGRVVRLVRRA